MIARRAAWIAIALAACSSPSESSSGGDDGPHLRPADRACVDDAQCESGHCIELPSGMACAATCTGECPSGRECKRADGRDPGSAAICVPAESHLCQDCTTDDECGPYGDLCLALEGGSACTRDCTVTGTCPDGFSCTAVTEGGNEISRQCQPDSGTCSCGADNDGLRRPCRQTNAIGTCLGEERCDAAVGWTGCDARTPALESCDGDDEDCDELIDEDVTGAPLTEPCGFGPQPRRNECKGERECSGGAFGPCSIQPPAAEALCDGRDDDCDGEVDEGMLGTPDDCNACGDVCPPGPAGDDTTVRSCVDTGASYACDPIACRVPAFDVNGLASDGCEVLDDHQEVGDDVYLNDAWSSSFMLGSGILACVDGDTLPPDDDTWFTTTCDLKLPSDDRAHQPVEPPDPNTDYLDVWFYDPGASSCSPGVWMCALFGAGSEPSAGASIEVCGSDVVPDYLTEPVFPPERCVTLDPNGANLVTIPLPNDAPDGVYYLRARSVGGHWDGTWAAAAYDWVYDDTGHDACPLGTALDPCFY